MIKCRIFRLFYCLTHDLPYLISAIDGVLQLVCFLSALRQYVAEKDFIFSLFPQSFVVGVEVRRSDMHVGRLLQVLTRLADNGRFPHKRQLASGSTAYPKLFGLRSMFLQQVAGTSLELMTTWHSDKSKCIVYSDPNVMQTSNYICRCLSVFRAWFSWIQTTMVEWKCWQICLVTYVDTCRQLE